MAYLCNTPDDERQMLEAIGVGDLDALFESIPPSVQLDRPLQLPPALCEPELEDHFRRLAESNVQASRRIAFVGGGAYDHFIPAVVDEIASRGEFYTAYTPYQPEASQGSLQAFFEYQTLICQLTGMEVSNASLYEGGTALSEAIFMAMRVTGRRERIVMLGSVNPEYRQVVETYHTHLPTEIVTVPAPEGRADPDAVRRALDETTACLVLQQPNVFGCLEEAERLTSLAHEFGALAVVSFDPISLGILKRPGDYGADIAVAEGQSLGIPLQYGGPYLGILACRQQFVRQMPRRLVGETRDRQGRRCYVLNLQTREQHIRRERATSNICTNQGLLALRAAVYLALLGPQGIREVAVLCCRKAHYAAEVLGAIDGFEVAFPAPFFKEFVLKTDDPDAACRRAREAGFEVGPLLHRWPDLATASGVSIAEGLLIAVTEKRTRDQIDRLAAAWAR